LSDSKVLFKTDTLCVEYFFKNRSNTDKGIAIVFSSSGNRSLVGNPYGGSFLLDNNFDVISFKSIRDDWFQSLPKYALEQALRVVDNGKYSNTISMGTSMGGFAAICFSRYFRCDRVLAYSPQFSIKDNFDNRFYYIQKMDWIYEISSETISSDCKYMFVYDNRDFDARHIDRIKGIIPPDNVCELILPHVGHELSVYLYEVGLIKDVTISLLRGNVPNRGRILEKRRESQVYIGAIANKLLQSRKYKSALVVKEIQRRLSDRISEENIRKVKVESAAMTAKILCPNAFSEFIIERRIYLIYYIAVWYEAARLAKLGFDPELYLVANPDVERMGVDPVWHYASHGRREGRVVFFR
jgi:hypothetical protein